jgi:hypothetical protein
MASISPRLHILVVRFNFSLFGSFRIFQGDLYGSGGGVRHTGPSRSIELCFTQAQWRLTEADGQIGISDLVLRNFLFKKVTKVDESSEHLAELGYISVKNLIPNDVYTDVLRLTEIQSSMPMPRRVSWLLISAAS